MFGRAAKPMNVVDSYLRSLLVMHTSTPLPSSSIFASGKTL
jgi:hypothetical protein